MHKMLRIDRKLLKMDEKSMKINENQYRSGDVNYKQVFAVILSSRALARLDYVTAVQKQKTKKQVGEC